MPRVMSEVVFGMRLSLYLFRGAYNFLSSRFWTHGYCWPVFLFSFSVCASNGFLGPGILLSLRFGRALSFLLGLCLSSSSCLLTSFMLIAFLLLIFLLAINFMVLSSLSFSFPFYFSAGQCLKGILLLSFSPFTNLGILFLIFLWDPRFERYKIIVWRNVQ